MSRWRLWPGLTIAILAAGPTFGARPVATPGAVVDPAPPSAAPPTGSLTAHVESTVGGISVISTVEPARATVGEPIVHRVWVAVPAGAVVAIPIYAANEWFEVRQGFAAATDEPAPAGSFRFTARVAPYDTGLLRLPDVTVLVRDGGGEQRIELPAIGLQVDSVLPPGDPPLRPPMGLLDVPRWLGLWAAGIGAALILVLLLWWFRRTPPQGLPVDVAPTQAPDVRALAALAELIEGPLWPSGQIKAFYVAVSDIVRGYLGEQFRFDALEMTTDELLRAVAERGWSAIDLGRLQRLVELIDLAKFANRRPSTIDHDEAISLAYAVIERTRRRRPRDPADRDVVRPRLAPRRAQ